jgi:DNA polymerase III subunit delta
VEFEQILQELRNKIYHPAYFLTGEEPYYIDQVSDYIENHILTEAEKSFNQSVFYGRDTDPTTVMESARRFPMMANQQVIIVKEAQDWKSLEPLQKYLSAPSKSTILVINYKYKKIDGRTELSKILKKNTVFFESKKVKEYHIPQWIDKFIKDNAYGISPQATQMLADYLGDDLSRIVNEIRKLFILVPKGTQINPDLVEKNIGISKDYNPFELTSALGNRDILKANRIITYFAANPNQNPVQGTTGVLFTYFTKLFRYHFLPNKSESEVMKQLRLSHPFIARKTIEEAKRYTPTKLFEIIGIIREYDMKSKGLDASGNVTAGDLYKEMIYKILH